MRRSLVLVLLAASISACKAPRSSAKSDADKTTRGDAPELANKAGEPSPRPKPPPEIIARLGDATLVRDTPASAIPSSLPGVRAEAAPDHGGDALLDSRGRVLAWYMNGDELCFKDPALTDVHGVAIGARLRAIPGAEKLACEVASGAQLLTLGDACPGDLEDQPMLVCELGSPFRRLFFEVAVDPEHAEHAGDELRGADLDPFGDAELVAMHLIASAPDPDEPKLTIASTLPADSGVVLAKSPGEPELFLRSGTPTTIAAIEAALPGFTVKQRRAFGVHIYRGSSKVATVMESIGNPFNRITLLGPGLTDAHGIEVGASVSAIAALPGLTCAVEGDEQWGIHVACTHGDKPQISYVFVENLASERMGEALTPSAAAQELGDSKLTAIEIANW
jgi:hypothetical protein